MTSEIKSNPNSSSLWSALNPLYKLFSGARPPSQTPHAVTSVITPQSGSFPSLLLVAGAVALLGVAYLIATRIAPYFFPKTPPTTPDLGDNNITVITLTPPLQGNGSGAGSPPPPVVPHQQPQPPLPRHNDESQDPDGSHRLPTVKPSSPLQISPSPSPPLIPAEDQRLSLDRPEPGSSGENSPLVEPISPKESRASDVNPVKIPAAVPRSRIARSNSASAEGSVDGENTELLRPPNDGSEEQAISPQPSSPPLISSSFSPNLLVGDGRLPLNLPETRSPVDHSPPVEPISIPAGGDNSKVPAAVPRSSRPRSNSDSFVDLGTSLSPASIETGSSSSSDSEIEMPSGFSGHPPSSAMGKLVSNVHYYFTTTRHFSKWTKYRLIQEQLEHFSRTKNLQECVINREDPEAVANIANAWNDLVRALLRITPFPTPDDQYRATVEYLRKARILLMSAEKDVQQRFSMQLQLIGELSYLRFAGIKIYPYCHGLIELATGRPLPKVLTLDTFQEELEFRTTALKNPDQTLGMNGIACEWNKFKGTANISFDPLHTSNVPYQDGRITVNGRSTLLLWHGTPVTQNDPWGAAFDVMTGVLGYIPIFNRIVPDENPLTRPPVINADYVAFIEEAARKNEKILHVVAENGTKKEHGKKKILGDESGRAKERLQLGIYHENFFPLALRFDGIFFERHDLNHNPKVSEKQVESVQSLKKRLKEQLLMPLGSSDNLTDSVVYRKNMDDQLAANGFCIPQKLRDASQLPENIDWLLDEVHRIYFPNVANITTVEEHQTFLILSYAHIILFMCWKLDISILEALCKDDKDRGNVLKTILKLHFLYITGKMDHETLTATLTHTLARPFILQKAPIIKSRLVLLTRVIPFIKAAHTRTQNNPPETNVFGAPVRSASYTVEKPQGQTIFPNNETSRTLEEYRTFLEYHRPVQISPCNNNLVQVLSREFAEGNDRRARIQQKISSGARNMKILVGGTILKSQPDAEDLYYKESAHAFIVDFLRGRCELSEEDAWNVSCSIQKGLSPMLQSRLNAIFANESLGVTVVLDEGSLDNALCGVSLTEENKKANIAFHAFYNITDRNGVVGKIKASMTIPDHATGRAQFEYSLV